MHGNIMVMMNNPPIDTRDWKEWLGTHFMLNGPEFNIAKVSNV
jgi:hypothetical protein